MLELFIAEVKVVSYPGHEFWDTVPTNIKNRMLFTIPSNEENINVTLISIHPHVNNITFSYLNISVLLGKSLGI